MPASSQGKDFLIFAFKIKGLSVVNPVAEALLLDYGSGPGTK
jgi:hypothetical protein